MRKNIALILMMLYTVGFVMGLSIYTVSAYPVPHYTKIPSFVKIPEIKAPPPPPITSEKYEYLKNNIKIDNTDPHNLGFWRWIVDYTTKHLRNIKNLSPWI